MQEDGAAGESYFRGWDGGDSFRVRPGSMQDLCRFFRQSWGLFPKSFVTQGQREMTGQVVVVDSVDTSEGVLTSRNAAGRPTTQFHSCPGCDRGDFLDDVAGVQQPCLPFI